jgi:hypothetical protein
MLLPDELPDDPPPRHSVLHDAWRQLRRAPSAALVLHEAGGVLVPRHATQDASFAQAVASLQHEASRQLLQVGSLDERPHPALPPLVEPLEPLEPLLELVLTEMPEVPLELELEPGLVMMVAPPPRPSGAAPPPPCPAVLESP